MDERANSTSLIHTDSIIIVHVNAAHDSVSLVSLPRDAEVEAPAYPASEFRGGTAKLGEVFSIANRTRDNESRWVGDPTTAGRQRGVGLVAQTISNLVPSGFRFNAVAIINHAGFRRLVTAMGGVHMCIDERVVSDHYNTSGEYVTVTVARGIPGYVYERGCRTLQPWQALDYVRQRKHMELGDGDYGRQRHQQQFLHAVFKQLLSRQTLTDVGKFNELRAAAGELLTLDLGGVPVIDWIYSFKGLDASDVSLVRTNGGKYATKVIGGQSYEILTAESRELLKAVQSDRVYDFLVEHPDWIAKPS
jgi:LCP family protein required for cell wall assembly